jgi:hypothetical protein
MRGRTRGRSGIMSAFRGVRSLVGHHGEPDRSLLTQRRLSVVSHAIISDAENPAGRHISRCGRSRLLLEGILPHRDAGGLGDVLGPRRNDITMPSRKLIHQQDGRNSQTSRSARPTRRQGARLSFDAHNLVHINAKVRDAVTKVGEDQMSDQRRQLAALQFLTLLAPGPP